MLRPLLPLLIACTPPLDPDRAGSAGPHVPDPPLELVVERFGAPPRTIDVLVAVDTTGSMEGEHDRLLEFTEGLYDVLIATSIDFHVGVVSTDMDSPTEQGKLREVEGFRWVDRDTPRGRAVLTRMVALPANTVAPPKARDALYGALELHADGFNAGFHRELAGVDAIAILDTTDKSTGIGHNEFIRYMQTLSWSGDNVVHAIVALPPGCPGSAIVATSTIELVDALGGSLADLCGDRWLDLLDPASLRWDPDAHMHHPLELEPVPGTLRVFAQLDGSREEVGFGWSYDPDARAIDFERELTDLSPGLEIEYWPAVSPLDPP